jgi:polyphenol oxidase
VLAARARLAAAVGLEPDAVVYAEQTHGRGVARVGRDDGGRGARDAASAVRGVDALVTAEPGVGVAVLAADCAPVLLVDPGAGVAAAHSGRRGTEADVVGAALDELVGEHGDPERVVAIVGPAIGACCYEVPAELRDAVDAAVPGMGAVTRWGTPALDVRAGVRSQLAAAGVGRVEQVGACTACGGQPWFSARRSDQASSGRRPGGAGGSSTLLPGGPVGRHAGIVCRLDHATTPPGGVAVPKP